MEFAWEVAAKRAVLSGPRAPVQPTPTQYLQPYPSFQLPPIILQVRNSSKQGYPSTLRVLDSELETSRGSLDRGAKGSRLVLLAAYPCRSGLTILKRTADKPCSSVHQVVLDDIDAELFPLLLACTLLHELLSASGNREPVAGGLFGITNEMTLALQPVKGFHHRGKPAAIIRFIRWRIMQAGT